MRLLVTTAAALLLTAGARADGPLDGIYRPVGGGDVVVIQDGEIEAKALGDGLMKFALDPSQTPAHVDVPGIGVGIYELADTPDGPELRISLARGAERPRDFADADGRTLLRLQKAGFPTKVWTIVATLVDPRNLSHPEKFQKAFRQPGVYWAALVAVALIVFTETGLLIGFLLPGDSLLVVLGIVAQLSGWNLWPFFLCLCAAAVIGDAVGYWIGYKAGPAIFNRPSSRLFKREYLQRAKAFYEKHGGKTIIMARFVPIVRTFVPVVAGAARMEFRTFASYNVFGGIGWIFSMILFGYYLIPFANPPMQSLLGDPGFTWAKHIDKVVVVVVFLSIVPILWKAAKHWLESRRPPAAGAVVVAAVTAVDPPAVSDAPAESAEATKPVA